MATAVAVRPGPRAGSRALGVLLEPYWYVGPAVVLIALVMVLLLVVGPLFAFQQAHILDKPQLR